MKVNFILWIKALNVIPEVSKEDWERLELISRWLISTRVAVLIMTFQSAPLAVIYALRDGCFHFLPFLPLTIDLIMAHASNKIFVREIDKDNYFRAIYSAQRYASGLIT